MESRKWIGRIQISEARQPLPLVEIANDKRVLIENHQGVCSYKVDEIHVRVKYGKICIHGEGLRVVRMTREQLVICGKIEAVVLERGSQHGK